MTTSVRLGSDLEAQLARAAAAAGETPSEFIRKAVKIRVDTIWANEAEDDPWAKYEHLFGTISGGDPNLSENAHERAAQIAVEEYEAQIAKRVKLEQRTG